MRRIAMGAAAVALVAASVHAQPGNNNGQGNAKGGNPHAATAAQAGPGKSGGPPPGKAKAPQATEQDRSPQRSAADKSDHPGKGHAKGAAEHASGSGIARGSARAAGNEKGAKGRYIDDDSGYISYARRHSRAREYGLIDGCPPGLAKKRNGCNPPGLVKRDRYAYDRAGWWGLPGLNDGPYRYFDNNLVRLSPAGAIIGYYPLLGGALSVGNAWPTWFDHEPVPTYYESYYGLGSRDSYRYADNVLYRVDPETAAITSVAALLTGDTIAVGQPMPGGYDVYNVPYAYRDRYVDGPNALYRYSDGYVYEIDPETMLVASAIELLM